MIRAPRPTRQSRRRLVAVAASTACAAAMLAVTSSPAATANDDPEPSAAPFTISTPSQVTARRYGRHAAYVDLRVRAQAGDAPFELISRRATYDDPIIATWSAGEAGGTLPEGLLTDFRGLPDFLKMTFTAREGDVVKVRRSTVCFNGATLRRSPDAPARSPYPQGCPYNPYTIGSVQGIQQGWWANLSGYGMPVRLPAGTYDVRVEVAPRYLEVFALDEDAAAHDMTLVVRQVKRRWDRKRAGREQAAPSEVASPGTRPAGAEGGVDADADGPRPDLRSLPAFDIGLNGRGTLLRFAANVWNAGDSPLVIDGFRDEGEEHMDAYQYFFDADGEQVGYQQLDSQFHFHRANHRHWHYEDFAAYRLLDEEMNPVRTSGKISFCLANTDAVDYTVPGADWRPYNTDLSTACGRPGSLAIREVLSSGSGDTYAQYRRGQAIRVGDLPDGAYYLSVEANPYGKLVEHDTTNNDSTRRIVLSTRRNGTRVVRADKVGIVEESLEWRFRATGR